MKYKIMILDIDGTLTNSEKKITEKTRSALIDYQERGGKIAIASGRPTKGIIPYSEELSLSKYGGYIMSFNGGKIIDCSSGETVFSSNLPLEDIPEICSEVYKTNVGINTYEGDDLIVGNGINRYTMVEAKLIGLNIKEVENFSEYVRFDVNKCLLTGDEDEILMLEKRLNERFCGRLGVFRSEPFFLEVVPKGIDKASSIDHLLKSLGIRTEECIACGDGYNDITMVKYAGLGVGMANANDKLKAVADYITRSNDEDGIAHVVQTFTVPSGSF